jgi:hypothetical protein
MAKASSESVTWTGKNLAEVKRFHKAVAHYPRSEEEGDDGYRDASQHPDNLHLEREDGTTLIAAPGDAIGRDAAGNLTVTPGEGERPKATGDQSIVRVGRRMNELAKVIAEYHGALEEKSKQRRAGQQVKAEGSDTIKGKGGAK